MPADEGIFPRIFPAKENSQVVQVYLDGIKEHSYAALAGARVILRRAAKDEQYNTSPQSRAVVTALINLLDALEQEKE